MFAVAIGATDASSPSSATEVLQGALDGVKDVIGRAKGVARRASTVLATMHEGAFPEKEVSAMLDALAESFETNGAFVRQFSQD